MEKLLRLIIEGWGSTGYYSAEMLARDAGTAFPKGTPVLNTHINNNSKSPARLGQGVSGDDLVGRLTESAYWLDESDAPDGAGVYAKVKFYDEYVKRWGEGKIDDMGFSIFTAYEMGGTETIDGRKGRVVKRLVNTPVTSVDAVVFAGAGGKVASECLLCENGEGDDFSPPVNVFAVEAASLNEKLSRVDRAFSETFNGDNYNYYSWVVAVYEEGEGSYLIAMKNRDYWRVDYMADDDYFNFTFASESEWLKMKKIVTFEEFDPVEVTTTNGETEMNLEELQEQIANLTAEMAVVSAELTAVTAERDQLATDARRYHANSAVSRAVEGVNFINPEAKELVLAKLATAVKWVDGKLDTEVLAEAAKPYTEGESGLVASESQNFVPEWPTNNQPSKQDNNSNFLGDYVVETFEY